MEMNNNKPRKIQNSGISGSFGTRNEDQYVISMAKIMEYMGVREEVVYNSGVMRLFDRSSGGTKRNDRSRVVSVTTPSCMHRDYLSLDRPIPNDEQTALFERMRTALRSTAIKHSIYFSTPNSKISYVDSIPAMWFTEEAAGDNYERLKRYASAASLKERLEDYPAREITLVFPDIESDRIQHMKDAHDRMMYVGRWEEDRPAATSTVMFIKPRRTDANLIADPRYVSIGKPFLASYLKAKRQCK